MFSHRINARSIFTSISTHINDKFGEASIGQPCRCLPSACSVAAANAALLVRMLSLQPNLRKVLHKYTSKLLYLCRSFRKFGCKYSHTRGTVNAFNVRVKTADLQTPALLPLVQGQWLTLITTAWFAKSELSVIIPVLKTHAVLLHAGVSGTCNIEHQRGNALIQLSSARWCSGAVVI